MMRIAASLTIAEHLLPEWIARWRISLGDEGPVVQLTAANSSTVVKAIREGTADLGFIETPTVPAGLRSVTVAHDTIEVLVQHGHRWAKTGRVSVRELAGTGLVLRETGSGTRQALEVAVVHPAVHADGERAAGVLAKRLFQQVGHRAVLLGLHVVRYARGVALEPDLFHANSLCSPMRA